jgi:hypothetical protein
VAVIVPPEISLFFSEVDMNLQELDTLIVQWGLDRMIIQHSTALAQAEKTSEEVAELIQSDYLMRYLMAHGGPDFDYHHERTAEALRDAIGDVYVTLVMCWRIESTQPVVVSTGLWVPHPIDQLQRRLVRLGRLTSSYADPVWYFETISEMLGLLKQISEMSSTTLEECVEQAYTEIKDRKGYLNEHGIFVKEQS